MKVGTQFLLRRRRTSRSSADHVHHHAGDAPVGTSDTVRLTLLLPGGLTNMAGKPMAEAEEERPSVSAIAGQGALLSRRAGWACRTESERSVRLVQVG